MSSKSDGYLLYHDSRYIHFENTGQNFSMNCKMTEVPSHTGLYKKESIESQYRV